MTTEDELKARFDEGGLEAVAQSLQSDMEKVGTMTLNIAITGESGTGKSSFVNALRGVPDDSAEAAPIGSEETTMEPRRFEYPGHKNVNIWDLPGTGTPNFQAAAYLERVQFQNYDFFIILSATRFKDNDLFLAEEIRKGKKKFYFVRSKIDQELDAAQRLRKSRYQESESLHQLKQGCVHNLQKGGIEFPKVFLISSWYPDRFDFTGLLGVLEEDLPEHKRHAFLLAVPNRTASIIERKKEAMLGEVWKVALCSAAAAAVPVPGVSIACDAALLARTISSHRAVFGLDEGSLRRLARIVGKDVGELQSAVRSPFGKEVSVSIVLKVLAKVAGAGMMWQYSLTFVPFIGTVAAASLSYATTHAMLKAALNEMEEDSKNVLEKAFPTD